MTGSRRIGTKTPIEYETGEPFETAPMLDNHTPTATEEARAEWEKCPMCGGSGEWMGGICSHCKGEGEMPLQESTYQGEA